MSRLQDAEAHILAQEKIIEELVSLNLWSARRLPKTHKEFAYGMLEELTNKKHERV